MGSGGGSSGTGGTPEPGTVGGTTGDDSNAETGTSGGTDSGPPEVDQPFVSGARLRAIVHRVGTDNDVLWRWRDVELDIECVMLPVDEAQRRCLPFHFGQAMYADAQCTEDAVAVGCDAPDMVVRVSADCYETTPTYEVVQLGETLDTVFCLDAAGQCVECSATYAHRATPVEIDNFASATETLHVLDGGLARIELEGEDGSSQWAGPFDAERNAFCEVTDVGGNEACVSYHRASVATNVHRDPDCQSGGVAVDAYPEGCEPPDAVVAPDGAVSMVGPMLQPTELFSGTGPDDCEPGTVYGPNVRFFETVPASADAFPPASIAVSGDDRLQARWAHDASQTVVSIASPPWFDEQLQTPCYATQTVDDTWICAPQGYLPAPSFFSDSACETPLLRAPTKPLGWASVYEASQCTIRVTAAARIGAEYDGPVYDARNGGCEPLADPSAYAPFWVFDEVIPAEALPVIEQVQQ